MGKASHLEAGYVSSTTPASPDTSFSWADKVSLSDKAAPQAKAQTSATVEVTIFLEAVRRLLEGKRKVFRF